MRRNLNIVGVEWAPGSADKYSIESLSPAPDTPVSWNIEGNVVSRYGQPEWDYSGWAERAETINFYYRDNHHEDDIEVGKKLTLLALFGISTITSLRGPRYKYYAIAELAERCRARGFGLRDISKRRGAFREMLEDKAFAKQLATHVLVQAMHAWIFREELGFTFMLPEQVDEVRKAAPDKSYVEVVQTPCIPTAVYHALIDASVVLIDRYLENKDRLEAFAAELGERYQTHAQRGLPREIGPFHTGYYPDDGFDVFAKRHRIDGLLSELAVSRSKVGIKTYNATLNNVRKAGSIIISAMTFMRSSEVLSIKCGGFNEDYHPDIGPIYYVRGRTTKTKKIRDAIWTTSAYSKKVFEALRHINLTHLKHLTDSPAKLKWLADFDQMLLFSTLPHYWTTGNSYTQSQPLVRFYDRNWPSFLKGRCILTEAGLEEALKHTANLPRDEYIIGQDWPLAHHQFRRTGLVRAAASGMVSHPSLTYQAQHKDPKQTGYYQRSYFEAVAEDALKDSPLHELLDQMDPSIRSEFEHALLDALNHSNTDLKNNDGRFFSAYGQAHKDHLLSEVKIISQAEFKKLANKQAARRTTLGACLKIGFCEYGTAKSVKGCMTRNDGNPCALGIIDTDKRGEILQHIEDIEDDLDCLPERQENEFLRESWIEDLEAAKAAVTCIDEHVEAANDQNQAC